MLINCFLLDFKWIVLMVIRFVFDKLERFHLLTREEYQRAVEKKKLRSDLMTVTDDDSMTFNIALFVGLMFHSS